MARGSIRKRSALSRQLVYDLPRGPDGKRRHKYETVQGTSAGPTPAWSRSSCPSPGAASSKMSTIDDHNQETPLLSALVVSRRYGIPGPGFF